MLQEFRRDKRDHYFLSDKGWRKVRMRKEERRSVWIPLALIVVALVLLQVLVDFI